MLNHQTVKPLPDIFIGKELLDSRVARYLTRKHPVLSKQLSGDGPYREDTRSVWYTREHVESWLEEIRHLNADGMRVYFGAYGDNEEGRPPGQLCLLMVMTRSDGSGRLHGDIILEDESDFEARLQGARSKALDPGAGILSQTSIPKEYNYGAPCPPICNPIPPPTSAQE
jgi:hypothetical protein